MDIKSLRAKTTTGLMHELKDAKKHLRELVFKLSSSQLKNVREVRKTKKAIAQIKSLLSEKIKTEVKPKVGQE